MRNSREKLQFLTKIVILHRVDNLFMGLGHQLEPSADRSHNFARNGGFRTFNVMEPTNQVLNDEMGL